MRGPGQNVLPAVARTPCDLIRDASIGALPICLPAPPCRYVVLYHIVCMMHPRTTLAVYPLHVAATIGCQVKYRLSLSTSPVVGLPRGDRLPFRWRAGELRDIYGYAVPHESDHYIRIFQILSHLQASPFRYILTITCFQASPPR
jgi:hypothetical protein